MIRFAKQIVTARDVLKANSGCAGVEVGFILKILSILFRTIVLDNFNFYTILPIG